MKKVITVLLVLLMLCALCACDSDETKGVQNETNDVKIEDTGKNAPSEDLIMKDLKEALQKKNEFATLTGVETVKSLTDEGTYEITLAVTAETKYADWQYTVDMDYTEYDQGWMVDTIEWDNGAYELVRMPSQEEISSFAGDFLYRACITSQYKKELIRESIKSLNDPATITDKITVYFETISKYMHGAIIGSSEAVFIYDPSKDQWNPESGENPEDFYIEGTVIDTQVYANFDGTWGSITISDFSEDGFYAEWEDGSGYFTHTDGGWYVSENGTDAKIYPGANWSEIYIGELRDGDTITYYAMAKVQESLPLLP